VKTLYTDEPGAPQTTDKRKIRPRDWRSRWLSATLQGPVYPTRGAASRAMFLKLLGLCAVLGGMCGLAIVYSIDLPQMEDLARYRPNTTTELLDVHGKEIGSFALERRVVVPYTDLPANLREAIISIEDKSFERNWGINLLRAASAAYKDLHSKGRAQGASTLTMQLARNLFLSAQKTYSRKLQEIFLTVQIERRFTKEQIFTLYANQIYLGHGRYGFEAGSEFYFSKHVRDLNLQECALLAAMPKGPELYSPLRNPERALRRRNLVLSEMEADGKITQRQSAEAKAAPLGLKIEIPPNSVAPYFVEEVRRQLEKEYGVDEVHGAGLRVYTTLDLDLQRVANQAVLDGTATYERRHGWKGGLQNVLLGGLDAATYRHPDWSQVVVKGDYLHGMVTQLSGARAIVKLGQQSVSIGPEDFKWTGRTRADAFLKTGDLVYVRVEEMAADGAGRATLQQDTGVQASMMAVDNSNGEVIAMVGGRDFALSQFNRATQSLRQVGSSFKPYVYTAAVEAGAKTTDIIVDAPTSFPTPNGPYTPHNYEPDWKGAMTLLSAFEESRNIPALKLADKVGIKTVIEVAHRFGITSNLPAFLPIAIGAADITLAEQVGAYSVFPNDGIRIEPHYIRKVTQADGVPLDTRSTPVSEVISVETARTMMTFLKAVVDHGTGAAAAKLKHPLGGKTGTTNDYTDAWFIGFSPSVTCGTWIGFDDRQSLGAKETGAQAALPMWIDFMKAAIAGKDAEVFPTGNAPKKTLDVLVTAVDSEDPETAAPAKTDADTPDPDAPATPATEGKRAPATAPDATPIPVAPTMTPAVPLVTKPATPVVPAPTAPTAPPV